MDSDGPQKNVLGIAKNCPCVPMRGAAEKDKFPERPPVVSVDFWNLELWEAERKKRTWCRQICSSDQFAKGVGVRHFSEGELATHLKEIT